MYDLIITYPGGDKEKYEFATRAAAEKSKKATLTRFPKAKASIRKHQLKRKVGAYEHKPRTGRKRKL